METANPRELKTLHVGKTRTTHGSKSHHRLRKWNSSLHHASSLKSFRTAFTHEHRNCKTGEGNDTANARMLAAHEKAFACYDSCRESERYWTSVFLVFSLRTRTYTKCIWQLELSVRETSETITEWFYHGSYILHDGRSWSWCHIILARVQFEYHCVWSSCTLGRGAGKEDVGSSLVFSIDQNLCRAVSEAEWKIPKQLLTRVFVKHLFRSAQAGHDNKGVATQRAMTLD